MLLQKLMRFHRMLLCVHASVAKWCGAAMLMLLSCTLSAADNDVPQQLQSINFQISNEESSGLKLEVRQAPLTAILEKIAQATRIPIHYDILPADPVTVTCAAEKISNLLECLLGTRVDRVYRYPQSTAKPLNVAALQPVEVWLLATNTPVTPGLHDIPKIPEKDQVTAEPISDEQALLEEILKHAASKYDGNRVGALSNLGLIGNADNLEIRKTLEEALTDKSPDIRTQAIASLMQREGENATQEAMQALKDKDVNVRLAVISNVYNESDILQQGLNDSDISIRELAKAKLDNLAHRQNN